VGEVGRQDDRLSFDPQTVRCVAGECIEPMVGELAEVGTLPFDWTGSE
jgi:hypothetical protein